jgi:hypothetical protein
VESEPGKDGKLFAKFVDYKSGKENHWDDNRLATDLKMKTTAWLVWKACNETPKYVAGYIEYIPTQWNPTTREVEPAEGDSVVAGEIVYQAEELAAFTEVIKKTIEEINIAYLDWLSSTDEFVNQEDIALYADLNGQKNLIEAKLEELKNRIGDQMGLGGKETLSTPFGTFYFTTRKTWEYPTELPVKFEDKIITLKLAEEVGANVKAAKKKFETETSPKSTSKTLSFRAGKSVQNTSEK